MLRYSNNIRCDKHLTGKEVTKVMKQVNSYKQLNIHIEMRIVILTISIMIFIGTIAYYAVSSITFNKNCGDT